MPKLSIITVNLNNASGLEKTIQSVINQTFTDYEYIIIDGGSTDGSVDIIKKYADKIDYWVSEPDKGIYNAMNKGIKVAKGEYCQFLNSGDWLVNNKVLDEVFSLDFDEDIVYGNLERDGLIINYTDKFTLKSFFWGGIGHPASFIKRYLFFKYEFYNENNLIVSDWEFFLKTIIIYKCSYRHITIPISHFDSNGISSDESYKRVQDKEIENTLKKLFPIVYEDYVFFKKMENDWLYYNNSRIVQLIKKIQHSDIYKKIRKIK